MKSHQQWFLLPSRASKLSIVICVSKCTGPIKMDLVLTNTPWIAGLVAGSTAAFYTWGKNKIATSYNVPFATLEPKPEAFHMDREIWWLYFRMSAWRSYDNDAFEISL